MHSELWGRVTNPITALSYHNKSWKKHSCFGWHEQDPSERKEPHGVGPFTSMCIHYNWCACKVKVLQDTITNKDSEGNCNAEINTKNAWEGLKQTILNALSLSPLNMTSTSHLLTLHKNSIIHNTIIKPMQALLPSWITFRSFSNFTSTSSSERVHSTWTWWALSGIFTTLQNLMQIVRSLKKHIWCITLLMRMSFSSLPYTDYGIICITTPDEQWRMHTLLLMQFIISWDIIENTHNYIFPLHPS